MTRLLVFILVLLAAPLAMAETVYKWTDENGVVHYGSRPPEGEADVDSIRLKSAPPPPPPSATATSSSQPAEDGSAVAVDVPPPQQVSVDPAVQSSFEFDQQLSDQVKQENCRRAQHNLAVLQVTPRVGQAKEDGSYEYVRLEDAERDARMQEAQDQISEYCG